MRNTIKYVVPLLGLFTLPLLSNAGGEELYLQHCKKCHGETGAGETAMGEKLNITDYTTAAAQDALTDEAIAASIKDGVKNEDGKKVMMSFGKKLSDEEVAEIVTYFRTLKK